MASSPADLMDCPVCWCTYRDPHMLPACGHTFCHECVLGVSHGAGLFQTPRCPTCRTAFKPGDPKPNFALRQLLVDVAAASGAAAAATEASPSAPPAGPPLARSCTRELPEPSGGGGVPLAHQPERLVALGVPCGLAQMLAQEDSRIGLRIFLLDNSGSTQTLDGHFWQNGVQYNCSRWEEITRMALDHAEFNAMVGTPCEFILLNGGPGPPREGRDFVRLAGGGGGGDVASKVATVRRMLDGSGPSGVTPLSSRLGEILTRIQREHTDLCDLGQRVVVVIVTDGMPTSETSGWTTDAEKSRFVASVQQLVVNLPVHVVIRLVTDCDEVVEFYNRVDEEVELSLEVLDDFASEAKEIRSHGNGWLVYTPLMHKIREGGTFLKLLDLLDERALTPVEVSVLAQLLLRGPGAPPFPSDPELFLRALEKHVHVAPQVFDPLRKRLVPPLDVRAVALRVLPPSKRLALAWQSVLGFLAQWRAMAAIIMIAMVMPLFRDS